MQDHLSTFKIALRALNSVNGTFFIGYSLGVINVSLSQLTRMYDLEGQYMMIGLVTCKPQQKLQSLLPLGAAVGALTMSFLLNYIGRRHALLLLDILGILGIGLSLIEILWIQFIARFIIGIVTGANSSIVPLYLKEFTPITMRGFIGSFNQVTVNLGFLTVFIIGLGYNYNLEGYWRIVFAFPVLTCILRLLCLLLIYKEDTPFYYVMIGRQDKAYRVLQQIYKPHVIQDKLNDLVSINQNKRAQVMNYSDLFVGAQRKKLIIGCLLVSLQKFSGINAIQAYSTYIFAQISDQKSMVDMLNIAAASTNVLLCLFGGLMTNKYGRKPLLFGGTLVTFLSIITITACSILSQQENHYEKLSLISVVLIHFYLIGFQMALGPITFIYLSEILSEKGVSIAVLVHWLEAALITEVFPIVSAEYGIQYCFGFFSICLFLGLFFIAILIKETQGRSDYSIANKLFTVSSLFFKKSHLSIQDKLTENQF